MIRSYFQRMRHIPRDVWLTMVGFSLVYLHWAGIAGVLTNLYLLRLGYDVRFVGLVNAAMMVAFTGISPLAGAIGRRWGCRSAMLVGIALATVGGILFPLGDLLPAAAQDIWLPTTYGLTGLGVGLFMVNRQVYTVAACGEAECDHAFAASSALGPVTGFVGSLAAGVLPGLIARSTGLTTGHPAPYRWPLLGAGVLLGVGALALWPIRDVTPAMKRGAPSQRRTSPLPWLPIAAASLFLFLRWIGNSPPQTFMNVYMDSFLHASTETIGLVRSVGLILAIPAALVMPVLTSRYGRAQVLVWGTWCMGLGSLALALAPIAWVAALVFIAGQALFSLTGSVVPPYTQNLVAPEWRSLTVGVTMLIGGLGMTGMALGGGEIIARLGYREMFLAASAGSMASGALLWVYTLVRARRQAGR